MTSFFSILELDLRKESNSTKKNVPVLFLMFLKYTHINTQAHTFYEHRLEIAILKFITELFKLTQ